MSDYKIAVATEITPSLATSIDTLISQLSSSARALTIDDLSTIVRSPATTLLIAHSSDQCVGMLTLVLFRIPTGARALIEDVVVDEAHRGLGIAESLVREAISIARASGTRTLDLTSRPSRIAANRLYQKLGFQQRESTVYRYDVAASL